jgi:hypothetical protein
MQQQGQQQVLVLAKLLLQRLHLQGWLLLSSSSEGTGQHLMLTFDYLDI